MSYGRPTLSGTSRTPFNRFAKQNSSAETSSESNGQVGVKTNGKRNGYHPYQSTEPRVRRDAIHRLTKGYELPDLIPLPISDAVASEVPSEDAPREFTFTPDYTYFRQLEQEEHKGRGESSSTTSFARPDFSTFYTTGLDKHTDTVRTVAWNTTGQYLATGSVDRVVYIWELSTTVLGRDQRTRTNCFCRAASDSTRSSSCTTAASISCAGIPKTPSASPPPPATRPFASGMPKVTCL